MSSVWSKLINLAGNITGVLPLVNGGTGTAAASANAAFNALAPTTTKGDMIAFSTVNARFPVGTNGDLVEADSAQTLGVKWSSSIAAAKTWNGAQTYAAAVAPNADNSLTNGSGSAGWSAVNARSHVAGSGDATGTTTGGNLRGPARTGSNVAGVDLTIAAGNGTGTGGSGNLIFQTAPVAGSSSTANTLTNVGQVLPAGNWTIGASGASVEHTVQGFMVGNSAYTGTVTSSNNFTDGSLMVANHSSGSTGKAFMGLRDIGAGGSAGFVFTRGVAFQTQVQVYTNNGTASGQSMDTAGPFVAAGGTSWTTSSDERIKNITGTITGALDMLKNLRCVYYQIKSDFVKIPRVGLIAQDVQAVLPQAVMQQNDANKTLGLQYQDLIPVLISAVNDLSAKFTAAQSDILTIKAKLNLP